MEQNQNEQPELPKVAYEITEHGHARWRGEDGRFVSRQTVADIFRIAYTENPSGAMPVEQPSLEAVPEEPALVEQVEVDPVARRFSGLRNLWQDIKPIVNTPSKLLEPEPTFTKRELFRSPKKFIAVALGTVALMGLGAHSSGEETERPAPQAKIERTIRTSSLREIQNTITVPAQINKLSKQKTKADSYVTPNNSGYEFFCLLPNASQGQQESTNKKGMKAPVVRITDGMYPWDVLEQAGMNEAQIMPKLDKAAKKYEMNGGEYAWHGSGATRWIEVYGTNKSYSDTENVMRILGPYLQSLTNSPE